MTTASPPPLSLMSAHRLNASKVKNFGGEKGPCIMQVKNPPLMTLRELFDSVSYTHMTLLCAKVCANCLPSSGK